MNKIHLEFRDISSHMLELSTYSKVCLVNNYLNIQNIVLQSRKLLIESEVNSIVNINVMLI